MEKDKKKLLVLGAGDYARALGLYLMDDDSQYKIVAYADETNRGKRILNIPVVGYSDISKIEFEVITIAADYKQTHRIIKQAIKQLPDLFQFVIENPIYNDTRVATFYLLADEIKRKQIEGSVAELGVYKGKFARHINEVFSDRNLYLFDTFEGFDVRDTDVENANGYSGAQQKWFSDTNIREVAEKMKYIEKVKFIKGYFPDSVQGKDDIDDKFVFVSMDADLYQPIFEGLKYFYPKLKRGGYILIHDYNCNDFLGVKKAVDNYSKVEDICVVPVFDFGGSVIITK